MILVFSRDNHIISDYSVFVSIRDRRAVSVLLRVLPGPPDASHVDTATDLPVVQFTYRGVQADLLPVWAGEGFPRDTRQVLAQLSNLEDQAQRSTLVITARRFSPGARQLLAAHDLSWADETGRAHIHADHGLLIVRDSLADAGMRQRPRPEMKWSESAGAVAEQILHDLARDLAHDEQLDEAAPSWKLPRASELADATGWSHPHVARILQLFDAAGWTQKQGAERGTHAHRALVDPGGMLSAWAGWHRTRRLRSTGAHATWHDADQFLTERLTPIMPIKASALTGWAALQRVAPLVTDVPQLALYLTNETYDYYLPKILDQAGLRPVQSGSRITFLRAEQHVLRQARDLRGITVVSNIRLYGDLLRAGIRGDDAAEHLRESHIGF